MKLFGLIARSTRTHGVESEDKSSHERERPRRYEARKPLGAGCGDNQDDKYTSPNRVINP